MPASSFWHKGVAFALIVLMLFLAAAISAPTAAQVNPHYTYTPSSTSLSVIAGDPAGDSFYLTVGLSFTPSEGWWADTQMIVIAPEEPFAFVFDPSSFILNQANQSQVVHVTVTAPEGTADGSRTIKAKWVDGSGTPSVGEGDGCTVSITVLGAPTPTPPPCFIATAAYGTSTTAELDTLRAFRDEVLLQHSLGSRFVALYYEISPPLADFISEHEALRNLVREFLIDPVVWVVEATEPLWRD